MSEVVSPKPPSPQQSPPPTTTTSTSFPFFEYIAKITLLVSVGLFVLDPIPPVTRLAAIVATVVVFLLARLERLWTDGHNKLSNNNNNNVEDKVQNLETEKSKAE
jgi:hypothetical protein